MNLPSDLKYARTHEWVRLDGDTVVVGITDPAQEMLGDVVFVGDVKVGAQLRAGDVAGLVESVKAASDIHAPVDGEVIAFNEELEAAPERLNSDPYATWIFKMRLAGSAGLGHLLAADDYRGVVESS